MTNNEMQLFNDCKEDPSLIFTLIKHGHYEIIEELIENNLVNVNLLDSVGNDVVTRLLKARQYDLVIPLMKKRNWDVNHQNEEGNTFGHILAHDNSIAAVRIVEQLTKKKNYLPNIKNNKGETALDRALDNNYLCTAFKILEDKRFNDIDVFSFKNLFNVCIKNTYYGKYSKLNNLEIIVENLEKKELIPEMRNIVDDISNNMDAIKNDIINNKFSLLETIINNQLVTE
jgi:ankyrin repeat protein